MIQLRLRIGTPASFSLSDPSGDSAIFEHLAGDLVIHHDPSYTVMTNDPVFSEQLAITRYWEQIPDRSSIGPRRSHLGL